jgi:GNAT superfamily N-acetyltransferase
MDAAVLTEPSEDVQARVLATLLSAFRADPVERWLYPTEDEYDRNFPAFLAAFGGLAFRLGTAWQLGDCSAVALWLPPNAEPDGEAISAVLLETVASAKHADTLAVLEQMDAAHPRHPHWYLPWFGVDAAMQGRGLGGKLMSACLATVDAAGLPAYLETPNPRTIPFYQRHGFVISGGAHAGECPPITFMHRPAR